MLRPLALSLMCIGVVSAPALAQTGLPAGFSPLNGSASMTSATNLMTVQQNGMRGVVRWSDFSIANGNTVRFEQSPGAVLLNRVVGSGGVIPQSKIDGTLNASGHIFLLNPSGVLFGSTAVVNVGGLVASTLNVTDDAFMARGAGKGIQPGEQFVFTRGEAGFGNVSVDKGAVITARGEGVGNPAVVLMGANVRNDGVIDVARGSAGLLSGPTVTLDYGGDGLTTFNVAKDALASSSKVVNTGSVTADGGRIAMLAVADAAGLVVNQGGVLQAGTLSQRNGEIRLEGAEVRSSGTLRATSATAGIAGGTIDVAAAKVSVSGEVDASGLGGGGRVTLTGGNVELGGSVKADALAGGGAGGGRVTVQNTAADTLLQLQGSISARGDGAGAGGTVVTESGRVIGYPDASVDAGGGATGRNGSWTLTSGSDLRVQSAAEPFVLDGLSTIGASTVGRTLGRGTDVTLARRAVAAGPDNGDGIAFGAGAQVIKETGGAATLTVNSARNITMESNALIGASTGALNVDFNADSKGSLGVDGVTALGGTSPRRGAILMDQATIASNGGDIRFYGQSDAVNGRAVGDRQAGEDGSRRTDGIELELSRVSACGIAQSSCAGGGSVTMRGEGTSGVFTSEFNGDLLQGTAGISLQGSKIVTGSGAVSLNGRSGIGAIGVDLGSSYDGSDFTETFLTSGSGFVSVLGSSRDWVAGDAVGFLTKGGMGVALNSATIATGGSARVEGSGGSIAGLATSAAYHALLDADLGGKAGNRSMTSGNGIQSEHFNVTVGKGQTVDVVGTGGSGGFRVNSDGAGNFTSTRTSDANAVEFDSARIVAESGNIRIDGGNATVDLNGVYGGRSGEPGLFLSTASATGPGGNIDIRGRNVRIEGYWGEGIEYGLLDVSGAGKAGTINVRAIGAEGVTESGVLGIDFTTTMKANAVGSGNGGSIVAFGDNTIRAFGSFEAKGAGPGGNGGFIETSGGAFDVRGIQVDTSAGAGGKAGTWLLDPFNVTIANGVGGGGLGSNPFVPLATSTIQDGDINAALLTGNVTITTGAALPSDFVGDVFLNAAQIAYSGAAERTFQIDAHRSIRSNAATTIAGFDPSSGVAGGKLNVVFNADVNGGSKAGSGGGQVSYSGSIYTNGGNVVMNGAWANPSNGGASIGLDGPVVDTRAGNLQLTPPVVGVPFSSSYSGGSDARAGGNVTLTGRSTGTNPSNFSISAGVDINGTLITTSTGNVAILGTNTMGSGVSINDTTATPGGIYATSGNISISGVGSYAGNSANIPGHGVVVGAGGTFITTGTPTLQTTTGNIDITGVRLAGGAAQVLGAGVLVGNRSLVTTLGGGDIGITGESQGNGAGVSIPNETVITVTIPAGRIAGSDNVVLRAANDGTTDALALGVGASVQASNVLDLRPGGVNVAGTPDAYVPTGVDRLANPITLGGAAATGFAVSAVEFGRITAGTIVAGSNAHAGNIDVIGPLAMASPLTLQNGGGGNIAIGASITTPQLGLVSAGNITQAAGANIAAGSLLARSTGGNVLLGNAGNNVGTVGGGAAGRFEYVDADALTVGPVSVTGFDAASNLPQVVSATGMQADTVFVRNLAGDMSLTGNVASTSGADLVTAARLQNTGAGTITGAPWRVWADTWVGETRGGLAGSGTLPNLFNCAYLGPCTVSVPASGNHFIYAQQPTAIVRIGNVTRPFGAPNPLFFNYGVTGLILGDTTASFTGTQSTPATFLSLPGTYPINGVYSSAAGYAVEVVPGSLLISAALDLPKVDVLRDLPTTYVYDRNIGQAPICLASGPLDGDRSQQGADVLAREWSKVRSRPNLLSCVDTERRNGCADF